MSNPVYQATVAELEAVLAPRLVSRSLQEGMRQLSKTPDSVVYSDIEKILKSQIYRQLQITMPLTQAKEKIQDILGKLQHLETEGPSSEEFLDEQRRALSQLQADAKPFNLYFEWPETQKLRAQIQLIEADQEARKDTGKLLASAQAQLVTVDQKLEDHLVAQARELGDLDASLERVKSLGGPKVRRLEGLLSQVHGAQEGRQLAGAEVERARKLAGDLRKLMGSSVVTDERPATEEEDGLMLEAEVGDTPLDIDAEGLSPEVSARLLLLDVESERFELEALEKEFANLLSYQPQWAARFAQHRRALDEQNAPDENLHGFHLELAAAQEALRHDLQRELSALQDDLDTFDEAVDSSEANLALQIALGILETTLPAESDVQHARNLSSLAAQQAAELEHGETAQALRLKQQAERLSQLTATLTRYREGPLATSEVEALEAALHEVRQAQQERRLAPDAVTTASQAAERLEAEVAASARKKIERQRAEVRRLLVQLQALPLLDDTQEAQAVSFELHRQLQELERHTLPAEELSATEALLDKFKENLQAAYQQRLRDFSEEAARLGDQALLADLHTMVGELDEGSYPDVELLKSELQQAAERRRAEQVGELHRLEDESQRYRGLDDAKVERLEAALAEARTHIQAGRVADTLERGRAYLAALQESLAEKAASFAPRLEAALAAFAPLEKLNSDETATLRRTLRHLEGQKDALGKVSPSVQGRLERSLSEAEAMLESLQEAFEATQAIAGQLVSDNLFDDALGLFEGLQSSAVTSAGEAGKTPLEQWLSGALREPGVLGAALFSGEARRIMQVGPLAFDAAVLADLKAGLTALQGSLELGALEMLTLETSGRFVLACWPAANQQVLIVLDNPAGITRIAHKLRRELPHLRELLGESTVT